MFRQRSSILLFIFFFSSFTVLAQKKESVVFSPELYQYEDSLKRIGERIVNGNDELERRNSTYTFIKMLVKSLKLPSSFDFPFDSVKSISILKPTDNRFRIFCWHLRNNDGTYRYYGAIQMNNPEKLELYPLFDESEKINHPEDTITGPEYWYGAHYYKILENKKRKVKYYTLLGWKNNDTITNKKVIDVLTISKETGKPVFGAPIFQVEDKKIKNRIVFEFTTQATMLLRYKEDKKWIVFDHLSPSAASLKGIYAAYGPDLSYDGLKFKRSKGKWILLENIDLRNDKSPMDNMKIKEQKETLFESDKK